MQISKNSEIKVITKNETKKKERQSNIELLRIIAILLIISFHYVYKSNYVFENLTVNVFIVKIFYLFGELGVNLFVLITGYFMVKGKFSIKKLIYLILEVEFCNIFIVLVARMLGIVRFDVSIRNNIILFCPIILSRYWFITAYILLYILSPFLTIFISNTKKQTYQKFLLITIIIWSVIPTVFGLLYNTTELESILYYSRFIWLIVMYFIGAYIRLYQINFLKKMDTSLKCAVIAFAVMLFGILIIYSFINFFMKIGTKEVAYFWTPNTIPMLILSVAVFEIFLKIKINNNKLINKLASTTLFIYMLHDGILNRYIWKNIFHTEECLRSKFPVIHILIATATIFIVGATIDLVRQFIEKHTVKKLLESNFYDKKARKINYSISKFLEWL